MTLTAEQIESIKRGEPVRLAAPEIGEDVVVIRESEYRELRESLEGEKERAAWARLGEEAAAQWTRENPY